MGYQQEENPKSSLTFLRVNPSTFAKLINETEDSRVFEFAFKLSLESGLDNLREFEKVLLTVRRKDATTSTYSNYVDESSFRTENIVPLASTRVGSSKPRPKYSKKVSNRIYSNLKYIEDIRRKDNYVDSVEISLSQYFSDVKRKVSFVELYATKYKKDVNASSALRTQQLSLVNSPEFTENFAVNTQRLLERMNSEVCEITQPITDDKIKSLNSASLLTKPETRLLLNLPPGKSLYYDIVKHYLVDVPDSARLNSAATWYEKRRVVKESTEIEFRQQIKIPKSNDNSNLIAIFELLKKDCHTAEEKIVLDLSVSRHVEAKRQLVHPPEIICQQFNASPGQESHGNLYNSLTIIDKDKTSLIKKFSIYLKSIDERGQITPYKKIGEVANEGNCKLDFYGESKFSIVRVIPVDKDQNELNTYTSTAIGPGFRHINNLTICPQHLGKNSIRVDVFNIPDNCIILSLFKRECTENSNSSFGHVVDLRLQSGLKFAMIQDDSIEVDKIYEYYVAAVVVTRDSSLEETIFSNYSIIKNIISSELIKSVNVSVTNAKSFVGDTGATISFDIKTDITPEENKRITDSLKEQLGELYEQFLNPSSNSSSPLGDDLKGVPKYSDLFFHEIIRTNLSTGARETFDLVTDGTFEDNTSTQKIYNINPIDRNHLYRYQIFTYKKNPIELFKKFVAWGSDEKGKEWFYLPYKWRNPKIKLGKLYADDKEGVPIIDAYDNFTSESFGMTAFYQTKETLRQPGTDKNVEYERIDSNTCKITWKSVDAEESSGESLYDSFVVMKVVNGVRYFVGRTHKNFIYHRLTEDDLGTIYYMVVPITTSYYLDPPMFSEAVLISPEGISEKVTMP